MNIVVISVIILKYKDLISYWNDIKLDRFIGSDWIG